MNARLPSKWWKKTAIIVRSTIFNVIILLSTIFFGIACQLTWPLSFHNRHRFASNWVYLNLWCLEKICGLSYRIDGRENIPEKAGVVLCKHESSWETLVLQAVFVSHAWVLKRELLWIPFLGWAIATLSPISIPREQPNRALRILLGEGKKRLDAGIWVTIFPEGTRISPGQEADYFSGGAMLAKRTGSFVLPIAHNAGNFWPRHGFIKKPGMVRMVIGSPIPADGRSANEINALAKEWIEDTVRSIRQ